MIIQGWADTNGIGKQIQHPRGSVVTVYRTCRTQWHCSTSNLEEELDNPSSYSPGVLRLVAIEDKDANYTGADSWSLNVHAGLFLRNKEFLPLEYVFADSRYLQKEAGQDRYHINSYARQDRKPDLTKQIRYNATDCVGSIKLPQPERAEVFDRLDKAIDHAKKEGYTPYDIRIATLVREGQDEVQPICALFLGQRADGKTKAPKHLIWTDSSDRKYRLDEFEQAPGGCSSLYWQVNLQT